MSVGSGWRLRSAVVFGRLEAFGERARAFAQLLNPKAPQKHSISLSVRHAPKKVSDILDFVKTVLQFNKLQRVDIGGANKRSHNNRASTSLPWSGTKGKVLSASVRKVGVGLLDVTSADFHSEGA